MNLEIKLDNTYLTISTTYNRELHLDLNIDVDDIKHILNSIYDVLNMEDFISTLNEDQMQEIVNYHKELENV